MKPVKLILTLILIAVGCTTATAQRRITPVSPANEAVTKNKEELKKIKQERIATDQLSLVTDSLGAINATDSLPEEGGFKLEYPLFHAVNIGLDVWDPVMRIFGSKYGGAGVWAELSLYNWIKPVFEFGMGAADNTPDTGNFTYKSSLSPFFKLGVNYNFLRNSDEAYQIYLGLRYGFTNFSYEITDININQGYWGETSSPSIPSQRSSVGFGEVLAGLKVKIYKNFYMGWSLKFHFLFHESDPTYGKPWYIPGYGTRGSAFTGAINLIYSLDLGSRRKSKAETKAAGTDTPAAATNTQNGHPGTRPQRP